MPQGLQPA